MFPWVYGYEWTPGHIIFTSLFLSVALVVAATVVLAAFRTMKNFRRGEAAHVVWKSQFHDLPAADRSCRHAMTGELSGRVCENGFDCRACSMHAKLPEAPAAADCRLYHRGHTWVDCAGDGTLLVGLDEIARKLIGPNGSVQLPKPADRLEANTPAFTVRKNGAEFRILAPVDGTVMESNPDGDGWLVRVLPEVGASLAHLLRGEEVSAWLQAEVERIQLTATRAGAAPALADGGVLVDDLSSVLPPQTWESVCGEILLDS